MSRENDEIMTCFYPVKKNLLEQHSKLTKAKLVSTSLKRKYYCRVKFLKGDSNFSRKGEV